MHPSERDDSLQAVFDLVGGVLVAAVAARLIGGVLAALGVLGYQVELGSGAGSTVTVPLYIRLHDLTSWADAFSAVLLLAALASILLPRLVWPSHFGEQWDRRGHRLVDATVAVSGLAVAAGIAGIITYLYYAQDIDPSSESIAIAMAVAASAVCGLVTFLAWHGRRYWDQG